MKLPWTRLYAAQADALCSPLTKMEIETVVFQMDGDKAHGPDGFPPFFYQKMWPVVQSDIYDMVTSFFNKGYLLKELNKTNITLIPKHKGPSNMKVF